MNNIGNNIRNFRIKKDMTQQFLADKLFVTRQCISRWEQGKTLPDIENLERLASVFECSINDLIDDNSVKAIAIEGAITNRRKGRIIWITTALSILALVFTGLSLYFSLNKNNEETHTFICSFGYVESIDSEQGIISFTSSGSDIDLPEYKYLEDQAVIHNNRGESIELNELKLNDKVLITYEPNFDFNEIMVIDSQMGESLYGVFLSGTGEDYANLEDLTGEMMGVNLMIRTPEYEQSQLTGTYSFSFISDKYYFEGTYDIYISLNPFFTANPLEIGLITSNGLRVVETIDPLEQPDLFTFSGEFELEDFGPNEAESFEVTYNIHLNWVFPFTSLEVYEYDKNGVLINETIVTTLSELRNFAADSEGLRCLVKQNKTIKTENGNLDQAMVIELLLGEKLAVDQADEYGAVTREWFWYK